MLTPVILPIWMQLGLSPIHLGIVMVLNRGIGLLTPPVGSTPVSYTHLDVYKRQV